MKKLIAILMVTLGVSSLYAEDSYLWWFVDQESTGWNTGWSNARIKATDGSSTHYLNLYSSDQAQLGVTTLSDINYGDGSTKGYYGAALASCMGDTWTYILEVYNSDNGWNGMSENGLAYTQAGQYISVGGTDIPSMKFDFGSMAYTAVPEPNSAMLLLLGLSALALRRKQKKA